MADRESGPERLGAIIERLVGGLGGHLKHEEDEALAVIDAHATPALLQRFGAEHSIRIGSGTPQYLPWLLDGATEDVAAAVLGRLPEPVRLAYADEWRPAFAAVDVWSVGSVTDS